MKCCNRCIVLVVVTVRCVKMSCVLVMLRRRGKSEIFFAGWSVVEQKSVSKSKLSTSGTTNRVARSLVRTLLA